MKKGVAILLHNVRSAHNVGSIFRTADAAGVSKIFLSGYTPRPLDRFKRPQKEIYKTALGAAEYVPWEYRKDPVSIIRELRLQKYRIVGVEQDARSRDYRRYARRRSTLFIFGNEVRGISPRLRALCDELLEIPMRGKKESLNVAVTAGIILFQSTGG